MDVQATAGGCCFYSDFTKTERQTKRKSTNLISKKEITFCFIGRVLCDMADQLKHWSNSCQIKAKVQNEVIFFP